MPVTPQISWQDKLDHIAARERELEIALTDVANETDNPYWDHTHVEQDLYEYSLRTMSEIADLRADALGPSAVLSYNNVASPLSLPQNGLRIIAVTLQLVGSGPFLPARFIPPALYFQLGITASSASTSTRYTHYGNTLYFPSDALVANVVILVEPPMFVFQQDQWILPPAAYDEYIVDLVHKRLQVIDFMPGGRV